MKHPIALSLGLCFVTSAWASQPLPALDIDPGAVTVSGLSSGGYMAVQLHVAHSSLFKGAGVVAAGPFYCAQGSLMGALRSCMTHPQNIDVDKLVSITRQWSSNKTIDAVSNLKDARVYLYAGTKDTTVKPGVVTALQTYYLAFTAPNQVRYKNDLPSEHAMVTAGSGNACDSKASPFINNCRFDLAGAMLSHLYGGLPEAVNRQAVESNLVEFDQTEFVKGHGMAQSGWAYIPPVCRTAGSSCKLHVALHGCRQNTSQVGMEFVRNAGYNRWAESHRIVVLYPQTGKGATNGCWDWWGYSSDNYATQSGPQIQAIRAMVARAMKEGK